jgi:hypothetical protein
LIFFLLFRFFPDLPGILIDLPGKIDRDEADNDTYDGENLGTHGGGCYINHFKNLYLKLPANTT